MRIFRGWGEDVVKPIAVQRERPLAVQYSAVDNRDMLTATADPYRAVSACNMHHTRQSRMQGMYSRTILRGKREAKRD